MRLWSEVIPPALAGERVDRVVSMVAGVSRAAAAELVGAGSVRIDGADVGARNRRVRAGERLEVDVAEAVPAPGPVPDVALEVVYADDDLLVVDKPAGLVVHPGAGSPQPTLVAALVARYPDLAGVGPDPIRPGIVHRLDKGTSGLVVVARTEAAHRALVTALSARRVRRRYRALAWGHPRADRALVDAPVGRSRRDPTRMTVTETGKPARTRYEVLARHPDPAVSELACELETGRTHQIRVHLAAIGHPVVGDARYGGARSGLAVDRPFLHAERLELDHPRTGEPLSFASPLPQDLERVLDGLGRR